MLSLRNRHPGTSLGIDDCRSSLPTGRGLDQPGRGAGSFGGESFRKSAFGCPQSLGIGEVIRGDRCCLCGSGLQGAARPLPSCRQGAYKEAIDAVSETILLARQWRLQGRVDFEGIVREVFRFGCRIHEASSPRIMAEFLEGCFAAGKSNDGISLDQETFAAAQASIWSVLGHLQSDGFRWVGTPAFDPFLAGIQELRKAEERLKLYLAGAD